jgi:hypothetical protein
MNLNAAIQNTMSRRAFGFLLSSSFLFARRGSGQATQPSERNGYSWKATSRGIQFAYVSGFMDAAAWAYTNVIGQLEEFKSLSARDRKILTETKNVWDYGNIYYAQLVDGMNDFYADNLNKAIKWDRALSYVRDCIHGEPKDFLETELNFERKLATIDSTGK